MICIYIYIYIYIYTHTYTFMHTYIKTDREIESRQTEETSREERRDLNSLKHKAGIERRKSKTEV